MFNSEEKIRKKINTQKGDDEFEIRFISEENVGVITSRSNESFFLLDSQEYWYDLIQDKYPVKRKCACKNDFFNIYFDYIPREGTDDYRAIEINSQCAECGKIKNISRVDIDYSPSSHLFEYPITYCKKPKIKYKTYCLNGFWSEDILLNLVEFLSDKKLLIYCWYWNETDNKRYFKQFDLKELINSLSTDNFKYLEIYFTTQPIDESFLNLGSDGKGVYVDRNMWRKQEIIKIVAPIIVVTDIERKLYYMEFCSEYINLNGDVIAKNQSFCDLIKEVVLYGKKHL